MESYTKVRRSALPSALVRWRVNFTANAYRLQSKVRLRSPRLRLPLHLHLRLPLHPPLEPQHLPLMLGANAAVRIGMALRSASRDISVGSKMSGTRSAGRARRQHPS